MIKFLDLKKLNEKYEAEFQKEFRSFLDSGYYILGDGVRKFEKEFADYCGVEHCVGVGNGLDALTLIFRAYKELGVLKDGDEILVPSNTFIASVLAITENRLKPVFVEPNRKTFVIDTDEIKKHISERTKAILAVHLYGYLVDIEDIRNSLTDDILIIEDAAQAHGAINEKGVKAGNLSDAAGFSFYPTKNLGALGDGGAITTNNKELAELILKLRNYGGSAKNVHEFRGVNSRLDDIQARFLSVKLNYLDENNQKRREIAVKYINEIHNPLIETPILNFKKNHVFHQFVIRSTFRDKLKDYLAKNGIETDIHYPISLMEQKIFDEYLNSCENNILALHYEVLSLPISNILSDDQIDFIIHFLNSFNPDGEN